ncbi:MAG: SAM-dependent methyltransferase [Candidatus Peribacteraceae bacterium]|nr:SAM-dependent methyltransferase [Candidatus Peribacteraceae bacterium]
MNEPTTFKAFDRYADFTDLKALNEWSLKPLRKSLRVNTLKCSTDELLKWGKAKNWMLEPVPWCKEAFFIDRVDRGEALGKDLLHLLGYFYMQEAASMLPVTLLDPQPGDRVLDMSAAPGSKTTQIADALAATQRINKEHLSARAESRGDKCSYPDGGHGSTPLTMTNQSRGLLIANDVQEKRIWGMLSNLQRCGVVDVIVTKKVGQWFTGNMTEMFDRVLCDAPCTAQGTVRKDSDALTYCSLDNIGKMAKLQRELLESAVHACKVGGRIVYSTCTLTPEENEDVVLSILNKFGDQLEVVDPYEARSDKREATSGFFDQAIQDSHNVQDWLRRENLPLTAYRLPLLRLWPQTYDTEGFFCAVLQKKAPTRQRKWKDQEIHRWSLVANARMKEAKDRLADWFGTPFMRDDEVLVESKEQMMIVPQAAIEFRLPVNPYLAGLPFAKLTNHGLPRLSHEMTTLRGREATKQVIVLSEEEMRQSLKGVNVRFDQTNVRDGDVLLAIDSPAFGRPILFGRGMLKQGTILNRLPREVVRMFA